jgi:ribosomal protein S18 acetylase RimI-like enzyme
MPRRREYFAGGEHGIASHMYSAHRRKEDRHHFIADELVERATSFLMML